MKDRTQLLRTFLSGPSLISLDRLGFFCSHLPVLTKGLGHSPCALIKGPQETPHYPGPLQLPVHTPTSKAAHYKPLTAADCLADPTRLAQARESPTGKNASSVHLPSTFTPGRVLRKQTGKSSMNLVQRKQ